MECIVIIHNKIEPPQSLEVTLISITKSSKFRPFYQKLLNWIITKMLESAKRKKKTETNCPPNPPTPQTAFVIFISTFHSLGYTFHPLNVGSHTIHQIISNSSIGGGWRLLFKSWNQPTRQQTQCWPETESIWAIEILLYRSGGDSTPKIVARGLDTRR